MIKSALIDKSWKAITSYQTDQGDRCVDIFSRPDGSFGFEEFRRDPEDMGAWTRVAYFSVKSFVSSDAALADATRRVGTAQRRN